MSNSDKVVNSGDNSKQQSSRGSGISRTKGRGKPPDVVHVRSKRGHWLPTPPQPKHRQAVAAVFAGKSYHDALIEAGYSEHRAKRGIATFRESSALSEAWRQHIQQAGGRALPSVEDRKARWWELGCEDMDNRNNAAVPILSMMGKALGILTPENQTVVQVAAIGAPAPELDVDEEPAAAAAVVTK